MLTIRQAQLAVLSQLEVGRRAARSGFTAKRDVCKYIDLMILFGRDFDTDKRSRWAGEILRRRGNPGAKMQSLFIAAKLRLKGR